MKTAAGAAGFKKKRGNHLLSPCDYHRPCRLHYRVRNGNGCFPARIATAPDNIPHGCGSSSGPGIKICPIDSVTIAAIRWFRVESLLPGAGDVTCGLADAQVADLVLGGERIEGVKLPHVVRQIAFGEIGQEFALGAPIDRRDSVDKFLLCHVWDLSHLFGLFRASRVPIYRTLAGTILSEPHAAVG